MTDTDRVTVDPQLGRILHAFEPPSLWQMIAGLIGAALGVFLLSVLGAFLRKFTVTLIALGSVAFLIGLWRYSERVEFGERGVRRRKWGGARELLYGEIASLVHVGSEDEQQYSKLRLEPFAETGKSPVQFYRFDEADFPQAERLMTIAIADAMAHRLTQGEFVAWLPGVRFRREGLELGLDERSQATVIPYRQIGPWEAGQGGLRLLRERDTGHVLLSASLDAPNFSVGRELLARLARAATDA